MRELNTTLACLGFVIVLMAFFERKVKKAEISESMISLFFGILFGPKVFHWIDPGSWGTEHQVFHIATSVTISMALMATALRLPRKYFIEKRKSMLFILTLGMLFMWVFSALIVWGLTDISFLACVLIGAIVTPTDPVIASSIVSGKIAEKYLPERIRNFISAESGANDGLAYCFVFLPLYLLTKSTETAWSEWFFKIILWKNLLGAAIGLGIGSLAGILIRNSLSRSIVSHKAFLTFTIALAVMSYALLEKIHCNGIIGVFASGIALHYHIKGDDKLEAEKVQETMERLFTIPIFVLFGAALPWENWLDMGWLAIAIPVCVLLFRRIPAIFILKNSLDELKNKNDYWFAGWFGPIGVAALYYASVSYDKLLKPELWYIPALIIFSSVIVHGITSFPFISRYSAAEKN